MKRTIKLNGKKIKISKKMWKWASKKVLEQTPQYNIIDYENEPWRGLGWEVGEIWRFMRNKTPRNYDDYHGTKTTLNFRDNNCKSFSYYEKEFKKDVRKFLKEYLKHK